ncbi:hypothetical protein [Natrinema halophilum]|uniref:Uncharacterized protein n=1 Tax=Natrinema halophilum TaxID=1699371 RepID=A0A7D5GF23_9EURY|nr:hypothetical protein [Natrinema halophilum]QLG47327.1 hypothetical protein HYG82_07340 [Natrinema halophilum]
MKRQLTITLTVAMIGSLFLMGFAGTAAATERTSLDDLDFQSADAIVDQEQDGVQVNLNNQEAGPIIQDGNASVEAGDGGNVVVSENATTTGDDFPPGPPNTAQSNDVSAMNNGPPPFLDDAAAANESVVVDASGGSADNASATVTNNANITQTADQSNSQRQNADATAVSLRGIVVG